MSIRRLISTIAVWLCVLGGVAGLSGAPAQAELVHTLLSRITEVPASSGAPVTGPLSYPVGVALDAAGDLYLVDGRNDVVDEFGSSGGFLTQIDGGSSHSLDNSVAVNDAGKEVYVEDFHSYPLIVVDAFSSAGALLGEWTGADTPSGSFKGAFTIAVDNSTSLSDPAAGDVYLADSGHSVVDVFKPEPGGKEKYLTQLTGEGTPAGAFGEPTQVAVDEANGDVLVADEGSHVVDVFAPKPLGGYEYLRQITGPPGGSFGHIQGLAEEGAHGNVYVSEYQYGGGPVYEFSATGAYLTQLTGFREPLGVAVNAGGDLYVADGEGHAVDEYSPNLVIPDVAIGVVSNLQPHSVTLNGTVNADEEGEATCRFEYGTTTSYGQSVPCPKGVTGGSPVPVSVEVNGLALDTTYHFRLEATNANNVPNATQDGEFTTPGPGVRSESSVDVASSSATLEAQIDPDGAATRYYFQYGTSASYGSDAPVPPGGEIPAGSEQDVSVHVQGLQPGTTYHYRVVASNEVATEEAPDQTFTTQPAGGELTLPDGRQWEMVTPPEKEGARFLNYDVQAAASGEAIALDANTATEAEPQGNATPNDAFVLETRGSSGWSSQDIMPPHDVPTSVSIGRGEEYRLFSEDLSLGFLQPFGSPPTPLSPEATKATPYLRTLYEHGDVSEHCSSSCFEPLVTAADTPPGTKFGTGQYCPIICSALFEGATPDFSHVVIDSTVALTSTPLDGGGLEGGGLYEWAGGQLQLVSVLPEAEGGEATKANLGFPPFVEGSSARHAISNDGSRVIWTVAVSVNGNRATHLYLRDMPEGKTVRIGGENAKFEDASSDGSRVFFLEGESRDLYEYNLNAPAGSRLTNISGGGVSKVLGVSEDGSYVYFAAVLDGCTGAMCLYEYHDGVVRLIAALAGEDGNDWSQNLAGLTVRVSPDGRWLVFQSDRELTGYDTRDALTGNPDEEVYLYNGETNKLVCASCNPAGARPVGITYSEDSYQEYAPFNRGWINGQGIAAEISGWNEIESTPLYAPRYLSDDGRLFFDSYDALVPQDVNGTLDVYEYEPAGVGNCVVSNVAFSERSGGCVGLISSGTSAQESAFVDASATGGDVFFLTNASLVSQDVDTAGDVYDAHECTAQEPCYAPTPVLPPACDTADSCKPAQTPQPPIFGAPSSETFSGAGNITPTPAASAAKPKAKPAKCRRGFVKKKGACVRKPKPRGKKTRVVKPSRGGRS